MDIKVQSLARIAFPVQTLICTTSNPRLCGDGVLDNEGTGYGLAMSSAYPTHSNLAFTSHPLSVSTDKEDALV